MTRALCLSGMLALSLLSLQAVAAESVSLPPFIERHIAKTVAEADVVALVTVESTRGEAAQMRVQFAVDRLLMGEAPRQLDLPGSIYFEGDLAEGTQLLVPLVRVTLSNGRQVLAPTHRYELVVNGHIREYPAEGYLAAMAPHIDAKRAKLQSNELPQAKARAKKGPRRLAAKGGERNVVTAGVMVASVGER